MREECRVGSEKVEKKLKLREFWERKLEETEREMKKRQKKRKGGQREKKSKKEGGERPFFRCKEDKIAHSSIPISFSSLP